MTQSGIVMSTVFIATIVFTPLFGKVKAFSSSLLSKTVATFSTCKPWAHAAFLWSEPFLLVLEMVEWDFSIISRVETFSLVFQYLFAS